MLHHLALPMATLGLLHLALVTRLTRVGLREALVEEYARTAYAKGLSTGQVVNRHVLRNALLPVVTAVGNHVGTLFAGAVLTEIIFAWPGLGRLLYAATLNRDYPLLMGIFLLVAVSVIFANLVTDIVYTFLDLSSPRSSGGAFSTSSSYSSLEEKLTMDVTMTTKWEFRQYLLETMRGYRAAQVLITCTELGVFPALGMGEMTAEDLGGRLGAAPEALARLMNAAVALGLLEKRGEAYANNPLALACLVSEGTFYIGNLIKREGAFYRRWSRLPEAVRTGQRPEENVRDERQANWVRDFTLALYDSARTAGPVIAEALRSLIPQRSDRLVRVIDVGGGHGGYSIALAQHYANLEAVVFDLPPVIEITRDIVAASDVADRVMVRAGDFKIDDLGAGFDLALLFGVLVSEPPADALALLRKVYAALVPGGWVVIRGFFLNPDRTGPLDATLFDLHMLLSTGAGSAHTSDEAVGWLKEAGFQMAETVELPAQERSSLLVARKPVE